MTLDTRARRAAQGLHRAVEVMEMSTFTKEPRKVERFDRYRDRKQRNQRIGALVVAAAVVITAIVLVSTSTFDKGQGTTASDGGAKPPPASTVEPTLLGTVTRSGAGCALELDAEPIPAGAGRLAVVNDSDQVTSFDLFYLDADVLTFNEFEEAMSTTELYKTRVGRYAPPPGALILIEREVEPAASGTIVDNFTSGDTYAVVCAHPLHGIDIFRDAKRPFALVGPIVVP